jgi:hypothetical protein
MIRWSCARGFLEDGEARELHELVTRGYLIETGQELQEILDAPTLRQCLGQIILCDNQARIGVAHRFIAKLPFRAILTTNYDEFIEGAFWAERGISLPKFYQRTLAGVLEEFNGRRPFLLKLHGDVNDPESIVLGYRSYERLMYDDNTYRYCLETLFGTSSVLFVGFGGSDPDLESILSRVAAFDGRRRAHWMLVPEGAFPHLKAKRLLKDKGVRIIEYKPDGTHSGVIAFLEALATRPPISPGEPKPPEIKVAEIIGKVEFSPRTP